MHEDSSRAQNPIRQVRKQLGLTQGQLALICQVSTVQIYEAERGGPAAILPAIQRGLEALGADAEMLNVKYQAWRRLQGVRLLQQVRQREEHRKACAGEDFGA